MHKQRILVGVVGFSDVERHALNTVFRLSQERELSYEPWVPASVPSASPPLDAAQVVLVDGECAEAVMAHVRPLPAEQKLIWVGDDPPEHAWRVWRRPIAWSEVLVDLDTAFAAHQVDSGLIDLDISAPAPLEPGEPVPPGSERRALVVAADERETFYLRSHLSQAAVLTLDEAASTEEALTLMGRHHYVCGVFNLDNHMVDAWALMRLFIERQPNAMALAASELAGPLAGWWTRRRMRRSAEQVGIAALLPRPLQPPLLSPWLDLL